MELTKRIAAARRFRPRSRQSNWRPKSAANSALWTVHTADAVARHLVAAGELIDEDPEAALSHARAARARSGRIAAVREAVGIAAYQCGDWSQAIAELRAARRMGSKSPLLPLIADCERGLGRPERALELARGPEAAKLTGDEADEMRIVTAGARADLGQLEQALNVLSTPQLDPTRVGTIAARLFYAYADTLLALDRAAGGGAVVPARRRGRRRGCHRCRGQSQRARLTWERLRRNMIACFSTWTERCSAVMS